MSGKSRKHSAKTCDFLLVTFILLFITINVMFGQNANEELLINQYRYDTNKPDINKGLRLQGIGNFFYHSKAYAKAVPYYQEALQYLPDEADITFRLGEIYQKEKVWQLSRLYYQETIELLTNPKNFAKSQLNAYISKVRLIQIAHSANENNVAVLVGELRKERSIMQSLYPKAWQEFVDSFDGMYPETAVRTP